MKHRLIILTILLTAVFGASAQTVIKGDISTATGKDIVNSAMEFIGTPYRYGVMNPNRGFDCSGFTSYIYSRQNISLPRSSRDQFCKETEIKDPKDLQESHRSRRHRYRSESRNRRIQVYSLRLFVRCNHYTLYRSLLRKALRRRMPRARREERRSSTTLLGCTHLQILGIRVLFIT